MSPKFFSTQTGQMKPSPLPLGLPLGFLAGNGDNKSLFFRFRDFGMTFLLILAEVIGRLVVHRTKRSIVLLRGIKLMTSIMIWNLLGSKI